MSPLRLRLATRRFFGRQRLPSLRVMVMLAVVLTSTAMSGLYFGFEAIPKNHLQRFTSFVDLVVYIQTHKPLPYSSYWGGTIAPDIFALTQTESSSFDGTSGYSSTNVQVEGVDEPDIVKTDGNYLYVTSGEDVVVVDTTEPQNAEEINRFQPIGEPTALFLYDSSRLVVISKFFKDDWSWPGELTIEVYNVTDPTAINLFQSISVDGNYIGARLIDNYLYFITNCRTQYTNGSIVLPTLKVGFEKWVIPAESIYYDPGTYDQSFDYTLVIGLDIANPNAEPNVETFLGGSSSYTLYTSLHNLYLAVSRYPIISRNWFDKSSVIHRFLIEEGKVFYEASGQVPGYLINQFALDEYNNHLRVATTSWYQNQQNQSWTQVSNVYTLNMQLKIIGQLEGLAPGEEIYSVRFLGTTGYIVTFFKTDPLFVLDLTNPRQPLLSGELVITGYSDYLHPLGNKHLLGIGKDTIISQGGEWWWYQGLKLSIFNATDPHQPEESLRLVIGARGTTSPVLTDHKAILINPTHKLLALPVLLAEHVMNETNRPPYQSGDYVWQGAYIFHLDHMNTNLTIRGELTHLTNMSLLLENYQTCMPYFIQRILYIGSVLFTVSTYKLALHDLNTLSPLGDVILDYDLHPPPS